MDQLIQDKINGWLKDGYDQATRDEIIKLQQENPDELIESFYKNLEFGTGGLRGIMGVGTNRINKYTIGMATQGFANYLKQQIEGEIKVAIAHDSRNNSRFFAETTANVFAANGCTVYLSPDVDLTKIKTNRKLMRTIFYVINIIKIPAPALEINSKGKIRFHAVRW